ncbi:MAG: hypothetical protein ACRCX2_20145 [Paraclostridium sp.]
MENKIKNLVGRVENCKEVFFVDMETEFASSYHECFTEGENLEVYFTEGNFSIFINGVNILVTEEIEKITITEEVKISEGTSSPGTEFTEFTIKYKTLNIVIGILEK